MNKVLIIGEILVEIMADTVGNGFTQTQNLSGPYPSGAPAIFADQMSKMGQQVALVSCVGNDDFGRLNLERLKADGVDISGVHIDSDRPTGSAFVRYRHDGSRDFIFNIRYSACGQVNKDARVESLINECTHIHVMGSSLSSSEFIALNLEAAKTIKAQGGTVSFDPNLRKEMLARQSLHGAMAQILSMTDLFLPSGDELTLLTKAHDPQSAVEELFALGIKTIVHKRGADGCTYIAPGVDLSHPAFVVDEIDPTGAGDSFGGAFATQWLAGRSPKECLTVAAAAGALAVTQRGPMEGTATLDQINAFIETQTT